jgi:hypothetical protein
MSDYKNIVIAGVWETKNGHLNTMPIDAKTFDKLSSVAEIGGKFLIRRRSDASIAGAANPETTPKYYLEFVPASEVKAFSASNKPQGI